MSSKWNDSFPMVYGLTVGWVKLLLREKECPDQGASEEDEENIIKVS